MKISILTPDISHNCLGRAYLLAKILKRRYDVEIIGPMLGKGIWAPLSKAEEIMYKDINSGTCACAFFQIRDVMRCATGDVIYASKPLLTSFGIGIIKKIINRKPLILDIDDWQLGFMKNLHNNQKLIYNLKHIFHSTIHFYDTGSYWNNFFGEKLACFADEITVSNSFLQKMFGGTIVWHARDTDEFNPEKFNGRLIRRNYKIEPEKKIIMFFGTPRPHKGIEGLIDALSLVKDKNILLVLAGIDNSIYCRELLKLANEKLGNRFRAFGLQPFDKVPEFLAMSDIIVIPQKRNFATIGQLPAKIFDAMSMAKPIIATKVSDIPEILDGCGCVIEPENTTHLAQAIKYLLDNPDVANQMGRNARRKCQEKYSWDAMEKTLVNIFNKYE